jgi:hypothetical protein
MIFGMDLALRMDISTRYMSAYSWLPTTFMEKTLFSFRLRRTKILASNSEQARIFNFVRFTFVLD